MNPFYPNLPAMSMEYAPLPPNVTKPRGKSPKDAAVKTSTTGSAPVFYPRVPTFTSLPYVDSPEPTPPSPPRSIQGLTVNSSNATTSIDTPEQAQPPGFFSSTRTMPPRPQGKTKTTVKSPKEPTRSAATTGPGDHVAYPQLTAAMASKKDPAAVPKRHARGSLLKTTTPPPPPRGYSMQAGGSSCSSSDGTATTTKSGSTTTATTTTAAAANANAANTKRQQRHLDEYYAAIEGEEQARRDLVKLFDGLGADADMAAVDAAAERVQAAALAWLWRKLEAYEGLMVAKMEQRM
ncbi:hypothetical protein JOL62DRAFT_636178 [Phyllosticta paracitricarpa]|uniref:Uncharacterized protein n=1 Tax=Phyllosticta paracitricarpa TaxID=2016321 RepID=A0ABR1NKC7_9PEZI